MRIVRSSHARAGLAIGENPYSGRSERAERGKSERVAGNVACEASDSMARQQLSCCARQDLGVKMLQPNRPGQLEHYAARCSSEWRQVIHLLRIILHARESSCAANDCCVISCDLLRCNQAREPIRVHGLAAGARDDASRKRTELFPTAPKRSDRQPHDVAEERRMKIIVLLRERRLGLGTGRESRCSSRKP